MEARIDLNEDTAADVVRSANNRPTASTPPTTRFQIQPTRTGLDSGYGTDYSPSPSSNTSGRRFVFTDDINTTGDACCRNIADTCDVTAISSLVLSEKLGNLHFDLSDGDNVNSDCEGNIDDTADESCLECDENDVEVDRINSKKCAVGSSPLHESVAIQKPCAPLPVECSSERDDDISVGSQCLVDSNTVMPPVVPVPTTGSGDSHINPRLAHPQTCLARGKFILI